MNSLYTLYGSYASYYTAKTRSYLRKKGIPFVERLPSDPMFRHEVQSQSGTHRIPQVLTPDGEVIQDSVEILDRLELRFPGLPAFPEAPTQRTFVHLMELLGGEGLLRLAWLHRWMFAENLFFVRSDFGRSFRPQGTDQELEKYGNLIAQQMRRQGIPEATPEALDRLNDQYEHLLGGFERHFIEHPYLLGGHPSAADYAIMGALHAHLGRDPAGLNLMQNTAPRVFRWVEHMIVPEVQSPEFFDRAIVYPDRDQIPDTSIEILRHIAERYGRQFILSAKAFNQAMVRMQVESGHELAPEHDQPTLPKERLTYQGESYDHAANLYQVWLGQRGQKFFQRQPPETRASILAVLGEGYHADLLQDPVMFEIQRVNNRLVIA